MSRSNLSPNPDLAREFRLSPFGAHSPELQELLNFLRSAPISGKHFLFMVETQQKWVLGRFSDTAPVLPKLDLKTAFTSLEDAEWHVFKERWFKLFGELPQEV